MNEIDYTDKSFDQNSAAAYSLAIQANSCGLAYCICDNNLNQIILFRHHRFDRVILQSDLKRCINTVMDVDDTLKLGFSRVSFLGYSRQSTLVPEAYFEREQIGSYLVFNNAGESDGTIFSNYIGGTGIVNIFSLPDELVSHIRLFFGKVEFMNQTTTFLRHITYERLALDNSTVYVGINPEFFDIACTGNGKLLLYNTFQYSSQTDLLYYILFVYNSMKFAPEKVPLILSGELSSKLSFIEILKQYISETRTDSGTGLPMLASGLKELNASRYLNLLNIHTCESSAEYTGGGK